MTERKKKATDELVFVPLGGADEIGLNLNLYGYGPSHERQWLMIDLGIGFASGDLPGVDVLLPDISFIEERREALRGLVLTHAHEDHIGAVPYLWDRLGCPPIYATPFTLSVLRRKLKESGLGETIPLNTVPLSGDFALGPFRLSMVSLTHSIPEPNAIAIRTPAGLVLHTGDWKLDPDPVVGPEAEEETLRRLGEEGVRALVCDSTNVFVEGTSGSEADLLESLTEVIGRCQNRIAIGCFASNVARLETIAKAAAANGRDVAIAGRSLRRMEEAARENGYLREVPAFLPEEAVADLAKNQVAVLCTGSQGEPMAALPRIAEGNHPNVALEAGDAVIFSSRVIPGNDIAIARLQNTLIRQGIEVITQEDSFVHVSGHPAREEMAKMYQLVRPEIAIPVHGEARHLVANAALAEACGVPHRIVVENGTLVRIGPGEADIIDQVPAGRLVADGNRLIPLGCARLRERRRMLFNGMASVTVVVDRTGRLKEDPHVSLLGLADPDDPEPREEAVEAVREAVEKMKGGLRKDDLAMEEVVRIAVRRRIRRITGKKPATSVHLVRV